MRRISIISSVSALSLLIACAPVSDADQAVSGVEEKPVEQTTIAVEQEAISEIEPIVEVIEEKVEPLTKPMTHKCSEEAKQGGLIYCQLPVGVTVSYNDQPVAIVGESGVVAIGLKQNASSTAVVSWDDPDGLNKRFEIPVSPRKDDVRHLKGMNCDKVDARTPAQKKHAGESWVKKVDAFAQLNPPVESKISFSAPANGPYSSPFGPTRHYSGVSEATGKKCNSTSVHRGLDVAVPVGTDLLAPMGGTVLLGESDLYYEGGTVFLDHGYGLVSVFLHLSEVDVEAGQTVKSGESLGATGNTGRTTGPHLHWAIKWRNTARDDRKGDFYIDPFIVLETSDWQSNIR